MFAWQSAFVPFDRVVIVDGPMHGFSGTVVNAPEPGRLTVVLDGFHEHNQFAVADTDVELAARELRPVNDLERLGG